MNAVSGTLQTKTFLHIFHFGMPAKILASVCKSVTAWVDDRRGSKRLHYPEPQAAFCNGAIA